MEDDSQPSGLPQEDAREPVEDGQEEEDTLEVRDLKDKFMLYSKEGNV